MAKFVLDNAYFAGGVSQGATDLTSYTRTVTINFTAAEQDITVMGNSAMARLAGLRDVSIDVEFVSDFADNALDETLWNWFNRDSAATNGGAVFLSVAPEGGAESNTNPEYVGTFTCFSYTPIGGTVGDAAMATASFMLSSGTMVTRDAS